MDPKYNWMPEEVAELLDYIDELNHFDSDFDPYWDFCDYYEDCE